MMVKEVLIEVVCGSSSGGLLVVVVVVMVQDGFVLVSRSCCRVFLRCCNETGCSFRSF